MKDKKKLILILIAAVVVILLLVLVKNMGGNDAAPGEGSDIASLPVLELESDSSVESSAIVSESTDYTEPDESSEELESSEVTGGSEVIASSGEASESDEWDYDNDEKPDGGNLNDPSGATGKLDEYGSYYSKDEVALYIDTYGELPDNYITKKEAENLGWTGGAVEPYAPGKVIGGDKFGNKEKLLPTKKGRQYYECDIDTKGKKRGTKRIVFSNDGLIYYTDDHYESFTLLYGEE
ncbi:MAG: ribonuclease [Acetatifactor sp.]|nr:ribonuclease [Acetatifactor sp.]